MPLTNYATPEGTARYAERFALPIRSGVTVERVSTQNGRYLVEAGTQRYEADQVVATT